MKKELATLITKEMLDCVAKINQSIVTVQDHGTTEDFERYRAAAAKVMASLYLDVLEPIYREHPDLEPEELKGRKD